MRFRVLAAAAIVLSPALAAAQTAAPARAAQSASAERPAAASATTLDYEFFKNRVQPIFLQKRPGHARCIQCHATGTPRLQSLPTNATMWTEEQSRQNFAVWSRMVVPGNPNVSKMLVHPLAKEAGGDVFHGGGQHWASKDDPEWQVLASWVRGEKWSGGPEMSNAPRRTRIIQTNSAGDFVDIIDPATNKVVGRVNDIEVAHGTVGSPDGTRLYITNESLSTVDVVDGKTLTIIRRVPLSGHPNNLAVTNDGRKVYAGIAQAPGAVDVIDTVALTNVKTIPVEGAVHNVYVTPDGKFAVSGSVASSVISVIDVATDAVVWTYKETSGIRPMAFETKPDGSTNRIFVQLSNYHGIAIVDWATHKETSRFALPDPPGEHKETEGLQAAPAHGFAITADKKTLLATSKWYGTMFAYSLPDLKLIGSVKVGSHPEWVTLTPDGRRAYIAAAGDNWVSVVDVPTLKELTRIAVGQVPKRNATAELR
jgi:YVTN family beta-propeller protein